MEKKVSVIIPVHNSSKYLKKCLDSVLKQTYKNIEVICIENGSKDNSLEILKQYKTIKTYSLKESGISLARNYGIEKAKGDYLYFLDSDDYIKENLIEKLVKKLEKDKSDLCYAKYYSFFEEKNKIEKTELYTFDIFNKKEIITNLHNINLGAPKLYKKEIITNNDVTFPLNTKYEDVYFVLKYIYFSNKISMVNEYLYYYVIHNNSETTTMDSKVFDILKIIKLYEKIYNKEEIENVTVKLLTTYTIRQRYQKNNKIRNEFIDEAFNHLNKNYKNWKKCNYLKERNKIKRTIEKNKVLTKIYCHLYCKTHTN